MGLIIRPVAGREIGGLQSDLYTYILPTKRSCWEGILFYTNTRPQIEKTVGNKLQTHTKKPYKRRAISAVIYIHTCILAAGGNWEENKTTNWWLAEGF